MGVKGQVKTGGRRAGSPNRKTGQLLDLLREHDYDPVREIIKDLPTLDERDRMRVHLEMIQYIYPKRKAVEHTIDGDLAEKVRELDAKTDEELKLLVAAALK